MRTKDSIRKVLEVLLFCMFLVTATISKTKLILQLSKSGANVPDRIYSGHPIDFGFEQMKDLSQTGMRQHFNLGRILRDKYSELIPTSFDYYKMNITVSDTDRTHSSAMSQIQGMYYKGQGMEVNTPDIKENWMPPFNDSKETFEPTDDKWALPNGFNFAPIESFNDEFDFMFKADSACKNIKIDMNKSFQQFQKMYPNTFQKSYDLFDKSGFNISDMTEKKIKTWDFSALADLSNYLTTWSNRDADQDSVKNSISYQLRAHMIFINSISTYSYFANMNLNYIYLATLLKSWKDILENFNKNAISDIFITRVGIFVGHSENLASLALSLVDPQLLDKIINNYSKFLEKSEIQNEEEFNKFLDSLADTNEFVDMRYGSSFIIELNSSDNEQESILSFKICLFM